jgi:hypothetical protein
VTVSEDWKPEPQSLTTEYAAVHPEAALAAGMLVIAATPAVPRTNVAAAATIAARRPGDRPRPGPRQCGTLNLMRGSSCSLGCPRR